jgi:hypothetical protein
MATTSQWYAQSGGNLIASLWVPRQMGVILMKDTFIPNIDTQLRYTDVSTEEVAAGGLYVTGGQQIGGRSTSYNALANEYDLLGNDLSWGPGATFSARYGIIYEMVTADKWLWALLDFGALISVANGVFQIDWAAGLLSVQAGAPV